MSDSEEENFSFYGKALDPYDEDLFPKKRPITVEEQIATDSHGRRRFHGAFTGGFSAGFFNTVGSLEGWTPSEFKSGRGEKQKHVVQNPEDFMDDEDMGEFGFAPHSVRATKDYDTSKKRKRKTFSDGPIPGEPVLHTLLTAGNETIGYLLLRNIGIKEKMKTRDEEISENKIYGCQMPKVAEIPQSVTNRDFKLPEIYEQILSKPKNDTFGLGYVGLDRSHVNIFKSSNLVVHEKDKKLSIRGQAFGVGAFENDDDDIYSKEDMSNYDFEITKEKEKRINQHLNFTDIIFDMFRKAKMNSFVREIYPPPVIPKSFTGKHKVKRSRFEPLEPPKMETIERNNINPTCRAELLGEEIPKTFTASKKVFPSIPSQTDESMVSVKNEDNLCSSIADESSSSIISPVSSNSSVQKIAKFDTSDIWNDRFVSAVQADDATNTFTPVKKSEIEHYSKEMRDAAKMKLFGPLTRISQDWQPCSLLCKRFNIPEPMSDKPNTLKNRTRTKNLVFEYQKHHDENIALMKPGLSLTNSSVFNDNDSENNENENKEETDGGVKVKQESEEQGDMKNDLKEEDNIKETDNNEIDGTDSKNEEVVNVEEVIDITDKLNIEEKGDLFKAIFMSSSESEGETEEDDKLSAEKEEEENARQLELKLNVLGAELMLPKIKPVKEGILSGLDFKSIHKFNIKQVVIENKESKSENKTAGSNIDNDDMHETNMYGPKLPEKKMGETSIKSLSSFNVRGHCSDEWVEKDDVRKNKKKKHKKEKSHKKKQKHKKKKKF